MAQQTINAVDLLKQVMEKREWHQGLIERRKAATYKILIHRSKLSYEKCCEILMLLGYVKIKEEVWKIKNKT